MSKDAPKPSPLAAILIALDIKDPPSRKRALVAALAGAVVLGINPFLVKHGYQPVGAIEIGAFGTIVTVYLGQSGLNSYTEAKAKAQAAPEVP